MIADISNMGELLLFPSLPPFKTITGSRYATAQFSSARERDLLNWCSCLIYFDLRIDSRFSSGFVCVAKFTSRNLSDDVTLHCFQCWNSVLPFPLRHKSNVPDNGEKFISIERRLVQVSYFISLVLWLLPSPPSTSHPLSKLFTQIKRYFRMNL